MAAKLLWSLVSRAFRLEWFAGFRGFMMHLIGAMLMGFGGLIAMGCTIGRGTTGGSTLAIGSIPTLVHHHLRQCFDDEDSVLKTG